MKVTKPTKTQMKKAAEKAARLRKERKGRN